MVMSLKISTEKGTEDKKEDNKRFQNYNTRDTHNLRSFSLSYKTANAFYKYYLIKAFPKDIILAFADSHETIPGMTFKPGDTSQIITAGKKDVCLIQRKIHNSLEHTS